MLTAQQVQDFLSKKLANFKVPKIIEFRDTLPREDTERYLNAGLKKSTPHANKAAVVMPEPNIAADGCKVAR